MSRPERNWQVQEVIAEQQAMNQQTWRALQTHGVDENTELRLDFFYDCDDADAADRLARFLREETDYEVRGDATSVSGSTQATTVSASTLDEWVEWMALAGYENGRCKFDGWGAAIPEPPSG